MRLREVFRFELTHTVRGAAAWVYGALLLLVTVWFHLATFEGDIHFNAPVRLAALASGVQMFGLLVSAGLFSSVAVRDVEAGMDSLLYTSPLGKAAYIGGRFLAALALNAALLLAIPVGQIATTLLMRHFDASAVGPFHITAYLYALPVLLLPNLLLAGAILFSIALLTRQVIPVYIGAILLFISGIWAANEVPHIASPVLAAVADWSGIGTLQEMTRSWTQAEQNTRLVGLPAAMVWARLILLTVTAGVLAILYRAFRFAHDDAGVRRRRRRQTVAEPIRVHPGAMPVPRVSGSVDQFTWVRQTLAVARRSFAEVSANRSFIAILAIAFGLTLLWGWNLSTTVFDSPVLPVTHLVASVALSNRNAAIIILLIALFAGEMVWKDRNVGMDEMTDASPLSEGAALLGRYIAVVATLSLVVLAYLAAGITLQALQGYYEFELGLYLRILFGINLSAYALYAALAMTIHVVVNQKYVGHVLMIAFFILAAGADAIGIHHNLLVYGEDPGWIYSDMNGFGPYARPLVLFSLYWAAWAMLLLVASATLWIRGRESGLRTRLMVARRRLSGATVRAAGVAVTLILVLGGFVFYNTNVLNDYRPPKERGTPQAEYEKRYKHFENAPQPRIVAADLRIEIHPEQRSVDIGGTFQLVNLAGAAIDSVHVLTLPDVDARSFAFDRQVQQVFVDKELGYRIFALARPLAPGDSLSLSFEVGWAAHGFPNSGIPTDVVANGSHFNRQLLPFIGYQPIMELTREDAREHFALAPRSPLPSPDDPAVRNTDQQVRNEDRVRVRATIGTLLDQTAITYGVLDSSWTANGRRYFRYDTQVPESFGATVVSARYAMEEDKRNDVTLRIFHDTRHTSSLGGAMHGMKAALDYFSSEFGPYPYQNLWMVEHPAYGGYGSAHPNVITFAENYFIFRVGDNDVDEPFYGAAHEVAHTWWGGMTRGAAAKGAGFLSESLANYSAMILMEKVFGPKVARRVYDVQMGRYFTGRARMGHEVPVLEVEGQPYIAYRRGALALYTLRERIGLEPVNSALRRYAARFRGGKPPYPTSLDLYAELEAVTPDSLHSLLDDLLATVTLWEVRTERASAVPADNGTYEVTLTVIGRKVRADSTGHETEIPMNDLVEVGVFAPSDSEELGEPLYLKEHRITGGTQIIRITVPRKPARAGIDPNRKLFDRYRDDNVAVIEAPIDSSGHR